MNYLLQELKISTNYERICLQCGRQGIDPWIREDPLEKGMATHPSILAWEISWTEEPDRSPWSCKEYRSLDLLD